MLAAIRTLYAYNRWANDRVLAAAASLEPPQFVAALPDEPSIRDTLVHIASAQWLWRQRWLGESPMATWHPAEFPDLAALRRVWGQEEAETAAFVAGLREPDLDRVVAYRNQQR
ncbi:MAG TPA: DinB family protein, partial [Thermomicrobiales bacterium]|nr:DinB family protein [Thermomicrobiales bacterium]